MNATLSPLPRRRHPPVDGSPVSAGDDADVATAGNGFDLGDDADERDGALDERSDTDPYADPDFDADADAHAGPPAAPVAARAAGTGAREPADEQLAAWIEAIVDRDERALTALYDATLSRVYGLVLRIVRRPGLAEEVVEDTYFQVWRQAARFDAGRGRALTWLLAMARSRAIDTLRREARFQHDSLDVDGAPEPCGAARPADELLDLAQGNAELHRALQGLNAQPRQLVALAFFRGLSHEEIASQTALPLGTVKSQIRRALISLRQQLGGSGSPLLAA